MDAHARTAEDERALKIPLGDLRADAQTDADTDAPMPEGTVFWTPGGKVYHTDRSCYHLAKSTNVCSGSVTDALEAGKTGLCSSCAKKAAGDTQN